MKIRLDEREIVAIIEEWARMVHKTKDVSSIFQVDITPEVTGPRNKLVQRATLNQIYIDLDVIIADKNYGGLDSSPTHEAVLRAKQALIVNNPGPEPVNAPMQAMLPEPTFAGPPLDSNTVPIV